MTSTLLFALETAQAGLAVLRAKTAGTPSGDIDDPHEDNTYNLPVGRPIRRLAKRWFARQLKTILGTIPDIGAPLPDHFPPLATYDDPMASAMTPLISAYWDEGGKTTRARLGLDPDAWEVHDPHLHEVIKDAAFSFCEETNKTTNTELSKALEQLRQEFVQGLVDKGDTIPELVDRVRSVFTNASQYRAERIARTEASRAVHTASLISAKESGVVAGKKWLVSANSCDKCQAIAVEFNAKGIGLDDEFAHTGNNPVYASIKSPPLHPHCRCSITYVLTEEYEQLLAENGPESPETYAPGPFGPDPSPAQKVTPKVEPTVSELPVRHPVRPTPAEPKPPVLKQEPFPKSDEKEVVQQLAPHSNPMIASAKRIGTAEGARTIVVEDFRQAVKIWKIAIDEAVASYHTETDVILINAHSKYWHQDELDAAYKRGWFSSNSPDHCIHHEIGHWKHRHNVGEERFLELFKPVGPAIKKSVEQEVSGYAATKKVETVAEMYAGMKAGKKYSDKLMGYYKVLGGVIP